MESLISLIDGEKRREDTKTFMVHTNHPIHHPSAEREELVPYSITFKTFPTAIVFPSSLSVKRPS